jgi:hypothetical protein
MKNSLLGASLILGGLPSFERFSRQILNGRHAWSFSVRTVFRLRATMFLSDHLISEGML